MVTHEPLAIVYYCTGHGLGHATRAIEVCKHLVQRGHSVTVVTGAPAKVFLQQVPTTRFVFRKAVLDSGSKQLDPFTVDMKGSLEEYHRTCVEHRETLLETESAWLKANQFDLVVSDVVPIACAAAAAAGVPAVCVSNFSWDFIYSEYLTSLRRPEFRKLVWQIAQDYAQAELLLRLPGHVPMPAFKCVEDVPLVVRRAQRDRQTVRQQMGWPEEQQVAVLIYGGHKAQLELREDALPPGWRCVVCNGGVAPCEGPLPPNFQLAPAEAFTPDLVNAADCVLGKIGYGTTSECLAHSKPLVFVRRDFFNEEPFLRKLLELHDACVEMKRKDFFEGRWGAYLQRATQLKCSYSGRLDGAEVVAERLEQVARHQAAAPAGGDMLRMRDTIVWGYLMSSPKEGGRVEVPEWYVRGLDPPGRKRGSTSGSTSDSCSSSPRPMPAAWHLLHGPPHLLQRLPDTCDFLDTLAGLEQEPGVRQDGTPNLPERKAAAGLFRWEDDIIVTRAPGRLDVMGGIADYSGALVLQMPIREACHVALQRQPLGKQRLWKHIKARHDKLGGQERPALRVVSFHADETNRGPAFDMDLGELYRDGAPLPYHEAREYFRQDPALSWAAYVAGCLVVLAHERGVVFEEGLALLVASDVPEGKGVSSSAAIEVAVMSALLAAYDMQVEGRELALLCQKAENLVVGAPCGIMDQMASTLGEEGRLLALLCQPAEVQGTVPIPSHIRLWGVDSGIRHSVGGADYGSVRVGTFMGRAIIRQALQAQDSPPCPPPEHLAHLSPSLMMDQLEGLLPGSLQGDDFLAQYGSHGDSVTSVAPGHTYAVRVPTCHPIQEHFRVNAFRQALVAADNSSQLEVLGELMLQSHASYSACGLGSDGTNLLVAKVRRHMAQARARGEEPLLLGAKITGGGCGGTVCILGQAGPAGEDAVRQLVASYAAETGHEPKVFSGSSVGSHRFGFLRVIRKREGLQQGPA